MKPSKLTLHFTRCHRDNNGKDASYFRALREKLMKGRTLSSTLSCLSRRGRDGLAASYKISLLIAQARKPHTIGEELLIPAIAEAVETVLHQRGRDVTNKIPLSNGTVQRRINAMAEDVEVTLCSWLRQSEFSLQVDESTLPGNEAVLVAYVRFIREEHFVEELLFSKELEADTREDDASLTENLRIRKADVAYLADLYFMFNEMNKQLLTEDLNLIKTKSVISAFMSKLLLFKRRFAMGELCPFQNLIEVKKEGQVSDADVEVCREHLQALHNDFASRSEDILSVVIPDWAINPFASIEDGMKKSPFS
ncbi:hypothetical protein M513_07215 [Trichuris suis]|uniref:Uncharacterized protein n=1 Tax=Trichuris suis TaxID=68888 RepID=A0A085M3U0_9BILA|nr:hypothetical protein M513_07215 [Trichuris suis]